MIDYTGVLDPSILEEFETPTSVRDYLTDKFGTDFSKRTYSLLLTYGNSGNGDNGEKSRETSNSLIPRSFKDRNRGKYQDRARTRENTERNG